VNGSRSSTLARDSTPSSQLAPRLVWTKSADDLLAKVRKKENFSSGTLASPDDGCQDAFRLVRF
jgi:hypothetical protein